MPEDRQPCFVLLEYVRGLTRPLREEGDEVQLEPIYELPERYLWSSPNRRNGGPLYWDQLSGSIIRNISR